jgi:hypothetical protein
MSIADLPSIVSTIGFPIVAFYLMYQFANKSLDAMKQSIDANTVALIKLEATIDHLAAPKPSP